MTALHERLRTRGIDISLRTDRQRNHYLRVSAHFYNTDDEIGRLIEGIRELS